MRTIVICCAALALSACVSVAKTYAPDGSEGFTITCSGTANSWAGCQERAGELCGTRGYDVLERSSDSSWSAAGSASGFAAGSTASRSMLIRCK